MTIRSKISRKNLLRFTGVRAIHFPCMAQSCIFPVNSANPARLREGFSHSTYPSRIKEPRRSGSDRKRNALSRISHTARDGSKSQKCSLKSRFASSARRDSGERYPSMIQPHFLGASSNAHTTTCTGATWRIPRSLNAFPVCRAPSVLTRGALWRGGVRTVSLE